MQQTAELLERVSELVFQRAVFSISHAIGTPLNVISGHAELLFPSAPQELRAGLNRIVAECRSITKLLGAPTSSTARATVGQTVAFETAVAESRGLLDEATRERAKFDTEQARAQSVAEIDAVLSLWTLVEIAARLSDAGIDVRAIVEPPNVKVSVVCTTQSEHPRTARDLAEPWRPEANPKLGHLGVLCHALAAVRGGRPVLTREGDRLELSLHVPTV